jgi:hypothetical protein
MIRRDDSMKSFRLEKATRPVGRPAIKKSFKLCDDVKSFKLCK